MPRLSIDITGQQHQQLKVTAALHGLSIKDFVLGRTFGDPQHRKETGEEIGEEAALRALHAFLEERLQQVRDGRTVPGDLAAVREKARQRLKDGDG